MKYVLLMTFLFVAGCGQNDATQNIVPAGKSASADQSVDLLLVGDIELIKTEEIRTPQTLGWESDCTKLNPKNDPNYLPLKRKDFDPTDVSIDDIINMGEKVWTLLKENEPVLEAKSTSASALPSGIQCWNQLSNWSRARAETYRMTYKNLYGMTVVDLEFSLIYNYGGSFDGRGKYLTNSTIQFNTVDVMWGFIVNANVEIPQVVNMASVDSPVAGMQVTLNWTVNTRPISLRKLNKAVSFFVSGDGTPTKILR